MSEDNSHPYLGREVKILCHTKNKGTVALEAWPKSGVVKSCPTSNEYCQDQIWRIYESKAKYNTFVCRTKNKGEVIFGAQHDGKKTYLPALKLPESERELTVSEWVMEKTDFLSGIIGKDKEDESWLQKWCIEESGHPEGGYRIYVLVLNSFKIYLEAWPKDSSIRFGKYNFEDPDQIWHFE